MTDLFFRKIAYANGPSGITSFSYLSYADGPYFSKK
jgi:hypothetical protein